MQGKYEHHICIKAHNGNQQTFRKSSPTGRSQNAVAQDDRPVSKFFEEGLPILGSSEHNESVGTRIHRSFAFLGCFRINQECSES